MHPSIMPEFEADGDSKKPIGSFCDCPKTGTFWCSFCERRSCADCAIFIHSTHGYITLAREINADFGKVIYSIQIEHCARSIRRLNNVRNNALDSLNKSFQHILERFHKRSTAFMAELDRHVLIHGSNSNLRICSNDDGILKRAIERFGMVRGNAHGPNSSLVHDNHQKLKVGRSYIFHVHARDATGAVLNEGGDDVIALIIPVQKLDMNFNEKVEDLENGKYRIEATFYVLGINLLNVSVNGETLQCGPFEFHVSDE